MVARTFAGWSVGFVLALALLVLVEALGAPTVQFPLALGMGLGVGALQAPVLRRAFPGTRGWVAATALGLSGPFALSDTLQIAGAVPFSLPAHVALGGVLAAALQWRLLRRATDRARWWLVVTPPGWLLAGSTVWLNEVLPKIPGIFGALLYVAVVLAGGLVLGAASAVSWERMVRPRP